MNMPRRSLLASAAASALGLARTAPAAAPRPPAWPVVAGGRTVAQSGVHFLHGAPLRVRLLLGPGVDFGPEDAPPGPFITGDFFAVEAGPPGEFALEEVDLSEWPDRPHPPDLLPSSVEIVRRTNLLKREWPAGRVGLCGLCKMGCNARPRRDSPDVAICNVNLPEATSADRDAGPFALYRADYPGHYGAVTAEPPEPAVQEADGPAVPVPGPLVADEDRREVESALEELAASVRADYPGRGPLVGYFLRKALFWALDNNGMTAPDDEGPEPDALHARKQLAMSEAFDAIDGQLGWYSDAQGRLYDSERRDPAIVAIVEACIGRLEAEGPG